MTPAALVVTEVYYTSASSAVTTSLSDRGERARGIDSASTCACPPGHSPGCSSSCSTRVPTDAEAVARRTGRTHGCRSATRSIRARGCPLPPPPSPSHLIRFARERPERLHPHLRRRPPRHGGFRRHAGPHGPGVTVGWRGEGVAEEGFIESIDAPLLERARNGYGPPVGDGPLKPDTVLVHIDPRYFRPTEVESLLGDPTKARERLGWVAATTFSELVQEMVWEDLGEAQRAELCRRGGVRPQRVSRVGAPDPARRLYRGSLDGETSWLDRMRVASESI